MTFFVPVVLHQFNFSSLTHEHAHKVVHLLKVLVSLLVVVHCDSKALLSIPKEVLFILSVARHP